MEAEPRKPQDERNNNVDNVRNSGRKKNRFELVRLLHRTSLHRERLVFGLASLLAVANGAGFPLLPVLFARTMSRFSQLYNNDLRTSLGNSTAALDPAQVTREVQTTSQIMLGLGAAVAFGTLVMAYLQVRVARAISARIRRMYFGALLRQDLAWYHANPAGTLTVRISGIDMIERAAGQTFAELIRDITCTAAGFILAFANSWKMTLIIFSFMPIIAIVGVIVNVLSNRVSIAANTAAAKASAAASETFTTIRTVLAFSGESTEKNIFARTLEQAYKHQVRRAVVNGFGTGSLMLVLMCIFASGFIIGNRLIALGQVTLDRAIAASALVPAVFAAFRIANAQRRVSQASAAAGFVLQVISRKPDIDPLSTEGDIIADFRGGISFQDVKFSHNDNDDNGTDGDDKEIVLDGLNFELKPGTSNGLCGHTGSGKSTIVSLIQRLYDIKEGKILLDGKLDIRDANIRWLRSQIGHVEQKPRLFQGTIRENIEMGVPSGLFSDIHSEDIKLDTRDVPFSEVVKAAKIANAHDFITALPNGYETVLGESGTLLSGGQKQRIAIARSLMSDPKILLLDECTANLDNKSEAAFQLALQKAAKNRTTLIVAHKLGTIRSCDKIMVLNKGNIVEEGTHEELIAKESGAYRSLMNPQALKDGDKESTTQGTTNNNTSNTANTNNSNGTTSTETDSGGRSDDKLDESEEEKDLQLDAHSNLVPLSTAGTMGVLKACKLLFSLKLSRHTWTALGIFGSVVLGISWPLAAACISELLVLGDVAEKPGQLKLWASLLVCCGAAAFVGVLLQNIFLSISGERFTKNAKQLYFDSVLGKDLEFFDEKHNSVGTLVFKITDQVGQLKSLTVDLIGSFAIAAVSISMGVFLACFYCWRVALVAFVFMPGIVLSGYSIFRVGPDYNSPQVAESVRVASEALHGIETLFSLSKEVDFMKKYNDKMAAARIGDGRSLTISLIASAYVAASPFCLFGAAFWVGSNVLLSGKCDLLGLNKATLCIFLGSVLVGELTYSVPNLTRARIAATDFFAMVDDKRNHDSRQRSQEDTEVVKTITGAVDVQDVQFSYASRPLVKVLKGLTTSIEPKKMLALVGESGSGKSTIISLIQRFYTNRVTGRINIDGTHVGDYNMENLRSQLGLVDQEPKLFNRSIRDNISYGLPHGEGTPVLESEIVKAAKIAGAHEFISRFPAGYDTLAGEGGGKLSGGERQRIAIARSLLRKPKILLLDEATSALDSNTEHYIQQSLAQFESTVIVVAHRLSTIRNAHKIVVIKNGTIVEEGTHDSLVHKKDGEYAKMLRISGSDNNNNNNNSNILQT